MYVPPYFLRSDGMALGPSCLTFASWGHMPDISQRPWHNFDIISLPPNMSSLDSPLVGTSILELSCHWSWHSGQLILLILLHPILPRGISSSMMILTLLLVGLYWASGTLIFIASKKLQSSPETWIPTERMYGYFLWEVNYTMSRLPLREVGKNLHSSAGSEV